MAAELQFHLRTARERPRRSGRHPGAARRRASLEFGGIEGYKEQSREAWGWRVLADLRADIVYGVPTDSREPRVCRRPPILSLALGVGANTLVFSIVSSFLVRPLPVERPSELFFLQSERGPSHSFPLYRDLRDRASGVASSIGYRISPMNVAGSERAVRVWGYLATGNYFDVLGVKPLHGRFFGPGDDQTAWRTPGRGVELRLLANEISRRPAIVGRSITINGAASPFWASRRRASTAPNVSIAPRSGCR